MNWTGQDVARITGGRVVGGAARKCSGVSTDSRTLGRSQLFVPLVGDRFDGHDFVGDALARGCAGAIVQAGQSLDLGGLIHVEVEDTLHALGELARAHLAALDLTVIAITGSNGKTSTKEMCAVMLSAYGQVLRNPGNFNNLIGLPLTAFQATTSHDFAVFEMGMNRPGEIARLTEIACPRVGLITQIAAAHLEGLITIDGVTWAKGELYCGLDSDAVAVVNANDPNVVRASGGIAASTVTVGAGPGVDVAVEGIRRKGVAGLTAMIVVRGKSYDLALRTLARHDVWNAALGVGVLAALGLDPAPGLEALQRHQGVQGRLQWRVTPGGVNVIDDTYNANPASVRAALETLAEVGGDGRRIAVLGDMLELGDDAPALHEQVGTAAADMDVDRLFVVGGFARHVAAGFMDDESVFVAGDCADIIAPVRRLVKPGDWVLVKGSRGMRMERLVGALMGEGGGTSA